MLSLLLVFRHTLFFISDAVPYLDDFFMSSRKCPKDITRTCYCSNYLFFLFIKCIFLCSCISVRVCVINTVSELYILVMSQHIHCLTLCVLHCFELDRHTHTHTHTHTRPTLVTGASRHGWVYTHLLQEDQPLVKLCECVMRSRECVCVCVCVCVCSQSVASRTGKQQQHHHPSR